MWISLTEFAEMMGISRQGFKDRYDRQLKSGKTQAPLPLHKHTTAKGWRLWDAEEAKAHVEKYKK